MVNKNKVILDLCGGTGSWSAPYRQAGYDVHVITLPEYDLLDESTVQHCIDLNPYGILCAVECTVWSNAGVWYWPQRTPDEVFHHAKLLVKCLRVIYSTNPKFYVIENPVGKMKEFLGEPQFKFNPCDFGHPWTKKTYLWGVFNPPEKKAVRPVLKNVIRDMGSRNGSRKMKRSITPTGFSKAFFEANK